MPAYLGTKGKVTFTGNTIIGATTALLVSRWIGCLAREPQDVTPFNPDFNMRRTRAGLGKLTGTIEGFCDSAENITIGSATDDGIENTLGYPAIIHLDLNLTTGMYLEFYGILTSLEFTTETGVPVRWTASFESSGQVAENVAVSGNGQ